MLMAGAADAALAALLAALAKAGGLRRDHDAAFVHL